MVVIDRHVVVIKKVCGCVLPGEGEDFCFYVLKEISIDSCLKP
jgi:hypothetical protein